MFASALSKIQSHLTWCLHITRCRLETLQTHVAIDKGLKWAIAKAGGHPRQTHSLQALVQDLTRLR